MIVIPFIPSTYIMNEFNPIVLRKTKIVYNFGLSECKRVKFLQNLPVSIQSMNFRVIMGKSNELKLNLLIKILVQA